VLGHARRESSSPISKKASPSRAGLFAVGQLGIVGVVSGAITCR
jgi:hypothetical protein